MPAAESLPFGEATRSQVVEAEAEAVRRKTEASERPASAEKNLPVRPIVIDASGRTGALFEQFPHGWTDVRPQRTRRRTVREEPTP